MSTVKTGVIRMSAVKMCAIISCAVRKYWSIYAHKAEHANRKYVRGKQKGFFLLCAGIFKASQLLYSAWKSQNTK